MNKTATQETLWSCDTKWLSLRYLLVMPFSSADLIHKFNRTSQPQLYVAGLTCLQLFRRLLSGHGESSGGRQRSQLYPRRPGALHPSALVYLHNDASRTDCWCSLNHQEGDEPDAHLHTADIETWRKKKRNFFLHNILLKNCQWHYGISFVRETTSP